MTIRTGLKRLAAVSTEIPRVHYREGLESGFLDDYESAIDSFDRVNYITVGSSFWTSQSQYFKANAYAQLEQYDKAVKEYKKYLKNNEKDTKGWNNLGSAYYDLEKYEDALPCFDNVIELECQKKNPDEEILQIAWENKGGIILSNDDDEIFDDPQKTEEYLNSLEQCVNEILKIDSESMFGINLKHHYFGCKIKMIEAIENNQKLVILYPDDEDVWNALGVAYSTVNNHKEALKYYEKAIKMKSNDGGFWYNKACALSGMNKIDDALDALLVAISIEPENLLDLSEESDFDNIKNSERFKKFLTIQI